jgi:citrate synthase
MKAKRYMTAKEVARELGIAPGTLYSYVSRGLIRSEEGGGTKRERKYRAEDVAKLKERKAMRRDPVRATEGALHWGAPLLESSITLIADGRLYYRGHDVVELALTRTLEEVTGLIWNGEPHPPVRFDTETPLAKPRRTFAGLRTLEEFQIALTVAGAGDPAAFDLRASGVRRTGVRIVRMMGAIAAGKPIKGGLAATIASAWAPGRSFGEKLIDGALILAADHELNVSSFTVRCVASAASTPYEAVTAGLAALKGTKHGGYTERVEAMMEEIGKPERAHRHIAARLRRGETIPGFGHSLYPDGDPRGAALMEAAIDAAPRAPGLKLPRAICDAMADLTGDRPTIDLGLVTLSRVLGLPAGSALTLFALGRMIGWIGHAIEQYAADRMIRPRARYTGRQPAG